MGLYAVDKLMSEARRLAVEYRNATGKTLPLTAELAVNDAVRLLDLNAVDEPNLGYDATADGDGGSRRYVVKGRAIFDPSRNYRIGQVNFQHEWDALLLVLMDDQFEPTEIYEVSRENIAEVGDDSAAKGSGKKPNLSVRAFENHWRNGVAQELGTVPSDDRIAALFSETGPLATAIDGFSYRKEQAAMAARINEAIERGQDLLCEAGTGTGKTFAYLAPILDAGRTAVISTATKPLQSQLVEHDLHLLAKALGRKPKLALLKGRSNYLCRHRVQRVDGDPKLRSADWNHFAVIENWMASTRDGDIASLPDVPEDAAIWPHVTSTVDNCLGGQCAEFERCFAVKARLDAIQADIVVVNHHLLVADLGLKSHGFGELLPEVDVVIIDEAHALIDVVRRALGFQLSSRQITDLAHEARRALELDANSRGILDDQFVALGDALAGLSESIHGDLPNVRGGRSNGEAIWDDETAQHLAPALETLSGALDSVAESIGQFAEKGPELSASARRFSELSHRQKALATDTDEEHIKWVERTRNGFILRATPVNIAEAFRERRENIAVPWIYTSATLSVANRFEHFSETLGIERAAAHSWPSPFDFSTQCLMYLPDSPVEPHQVNFAEHVASIVERIVALCNGRTFVLFTSHAVLNRVTTILQGKLDVPVMVQGSAPREILIQEFTKAGNAVLFGAASFWEGVDVRGDALSAVVIDKLPFPRPDDPLRLARGQVLKNEGRDPFRHDSLPSAVLQLKQGVGRLIRDYSDRGIITICDPRIRTKGYGKVFLRSLPTMPITGSFADVTRWWHGE